jgi:DNA polymerase II
MPATATQTCFLLNYNYRDRNNRFEITLYAVSSDRVPVKIVVDTFRPLFFVPHALPADAAPGAAERKALPLRAMTDGATVDCLYFPTSNASIESGRDLRAKGFTVFESDVNPVERYLMERLVAGGFEAVGAWSRQDGFLCCRNPTVRGVAVTPQLSVLSLDIETNAKTNEILSIACSGKNDSVVIRGTGAAAPPIVFCGSERELLTKFFDHLKSEDPDVLIGWNVVDFDLSVLQERCAALRVPFAMGRDAGGRIVETRRDNTKIARIPGRAVIDVPVMLRANFYSFEEYSLDFVANAMLGRGKTITATGEAKIDEIIRLFNEAPDALARYNLTDAQLTKEIFDRAGILPNAVERSKRSGLLLDRTGGSVAAFDHLYLPRLHRAGYVAPDAADVRLPSSPLPGGFVLEPKPGLYENVLVFDFRSLYPSIIMTFKIDPLGLVAPSARRVQGPCGPSFADDTTILPGIIAQLMEARAQAKRDNNPYLSQAIKILMNSFYGVLGAAGCRFFSADLAATITQTGQYLLKQTIAHIEAATSCPVIYGDTDSLFVLLGKGRDAGAQATGQTIAQEVTAWLASMVAERFGAVSALELQFERHFRHFFLPSLRGSSQGSKKHYCGSVVDGAKTALVFKGMESARSDWTDLAKEFQHELLLRLFAGKPVEEFVAATAEKIRAGGVDGKLVYKKRLRKQLDEYTDHVPPHAQAAKLLASPRHLIRYYITTNGPQPIENRTAPIDYEHYVECQLKPVADSVLELLGTSFDKIISGQQELFS